MPSRKAARTPQAKVTHGRCIGEDSIIHRGSKVHLAAQLDNFASNDVRENRQNEQQLPNCGRVAAVDELHQQWQNSLERQKAIIGRKHQDMCQKAQQENARREAVWEREDTYVASLRNRDVAKNNISGESFDIITLHYHNSPGGERLKDEDDRIRYKAVLRTRALVRAQHSVPHDIITGENLNLDRHIILQTPSSN